MIGIIIDISVVMLFLSSIKFHEKGDEKMKKLSLALVIGFSLVLIAGGAFAATDTKNLTVNAIVAGSATLTIDKAVINFPDANPGTTPSIPNSDGAVTVTANVRTAANGAVTLTHRADTDLTSGTDHIGINQVTWTVASGTGFVPGTMSNSAPVSAGSWSGSGSYTGSFNYALANSWSYAVGTYTASSTYTLTTP
jgi:hypothetical protein